MTRLFSFWIFLFLTNTIHAQPPTETWMSVLLDGRKIGHMQSTREIQGDRVQSKQRMEIGLERAGFNIALTTEESSEETPDGKPLAFQSRSKLSGIETLVNGVVRKDDQVEITTTMVGNKQTRTMPWPKNALLAEGLRLASVKAGLKPGTKFTSIAFESSSQQAVSATSTVKGEEWVDLPDGRRKLSLVEQDISMSGIPMHSRTWVDADQTVYKVIMPLLGFNLTLISCKKSCALAPNQSTDVFEHALLHSPRALNPEELQQGLKFRMRATDNQEPLFFATTDEQQVTQLANGVVEVKVLARPPENSEIREEKPQYIDFHPTDWLQSKEPEIEKLAKQAVGDTDSNLEKMKILEKFVREHIHKKNLTVGYASALEVARSLEGDCTEHAVLLAALGRALGIATRVVSGLAYTDNFDNAEHIFVPHAWAQAWVGGRWQSFDAALHGFDAGHIALSVGNGDPWRFYSGLNTLGRVRILEVQSTLAGK